MKEGSIDVEISVRIRLMVSMMWAVTTSNAMMVSTFSSMQNPHLYEIEEDTDSSDKEHDVGIDLCWISDSINSFKDKQ